MKEEAPDEENGLRIISETMSFGWSRVSGNIIAELSNWSWCGYWKVFRRVCGSEFG